MREGTERLKEVDKKEDYCKLVSSEYDRTTVFTNSKWLCLSAQDQANHFSSMEKWVSRAH